MCTLQRFRINPCLERNTFQCIINFQGKPWTLIAYKNWSQRTNSEFWVGVKDTRSFVPINVSFCYLPLERCFGLCYMTMRRSPRLGNFREKGKTQAPFCCQSFCRCQLYNRILFQGVKRCQHLSLLIFLNENGSTK